MLEKEKEEPLEEKMNEKMNKDFARVAQPRERSRPTLLLLLQGLRQRPCQMKKATLLRAAVHQTDQAVAVLEARQIQALEARQIQALAQAG